MRYVSVGLLTGMILHFSCGYNILGIFPTMSKSHYITGGALMRGLADAGHQVTVISPYPQKAPIANYRDYPIVGIVEAVQKKMPNLLLAMNDLNALQMLPNVHEMGLFITNFTLTHPRMTEFLADPNEHYDLVICEIFVSEAMLGLGHHFNAPIIGFSTFGSSMWTNHLVGTPSPLSYVPHPFLSFSNRMTFVQRLGNTLMTAFQLYTFNTFLDQQQVIYEQIFSDPNKPTVQQLRQNVALVLLNQHFTLSYPQPYVPNMIEVGGIHINREAPKALPDDIRRFVEGAEHGVVYFSMGSNIQSAQLPVVMREDLLRSFGKLKQRVLWKWETPDLPGKPSNVLISKWFPQDDILAHPNVKVFVTHGGLLSMSEAVYHGLPIIGIPVFGDQFLNMGRAQDSGYGLMVAYKNVTEKSMSWALDELLNKEKYSIAAQTMSARYRDQPMPPLELAKFWVEYVIRHKGAPHLHSAGQDLTFIEYHSIDVFAAIALTLALIVYFAYWIIVSLISLATGSKVKSAGSKASSAYKKRN